MLVDLHVHTSRYSPCGRSTPEEMIERAVAMGLGGMAITEHNVVWSAEDIAALQERYPAVRLFRGVEITADTGDHYVVLGGTAPDAVAEGMSGCEIVERVRAAGGAVSLAHPYRYRPEVPASLAECPVDAIEVCSSNIFCYAHRKAVALCEHLGVRPIAASDGHHVDTLALYAVDLARPASTDDDLAALVRQGAYRRQANARQVGAYNDALPDMIRRVRGLIATGLSDDEIRRVVGPVTYTFIQGVRKGRDVRRPT